MESSISTPVDPEWVFDNWLFFRSPHPVIYTLIAYLYFVLHLGPQLMKNRPALSLNRVLLGYNLYQVIFNLWLCLELLCSTNGLPCITRGCCIYRPATSEGFRFTLPFLGMCYGISKVVDLLDTVIFVLRKKFNQVTFLHVYHHAVMVLFLWLFVKYSADPHSLFIAIVNTFVHVVMYSYYLISTLGPKYQKFLWWKKYVTLLQLIQFGMILVYLITVFLIGCGVSIFLVLFFSANVILFVLLFWNFYREAYKGKLSSKTD